MSVKPGDSIVWFETLRSPYGGNSDADSLPSGGLYRNGTVDGAVTVTVTKVPAVTGQYTYSYTVPIGYSSGDSVELSRTATVSAITESNIIWGAQLDARRISDISDNTGAVTIAFGTALPANPTTGTVGDALFIISKLASRRNTAQAGSTSTTIVLDAGASATDNTYQNFLVYLWTGTGAGQYRTVVSYAGSTKIGSINPEKPWTITPDATTGYMMFPQPVANVVMWAGNIVNGLISGRIDANSQVVGDKTGYALTTGEHTNVASDVSMAMTAQGYTSTRANYLDVLNGLIAGIWTYVGGRTLTVFGFTVATTANSTETAIKAKTDNLPNDPMSQATYVAPDNTGIGNAVTAANSAKNSADAAAAAASSAASSAVTAASEATIAAEQATIAANNTNDVNMSEGSVVVNVSVVDNNNNPVPNAVLQIGDRSINTLNNGTISFTLNPSTYTIYAVSPSLVFPPSTLVVTSPGPISKTMTANAVYVPPVLPDPDDCNCYMEVDLPITGIVTATVTITDLPQNISGRWLKGTTLSYNADSNGIISFPAPKTGKIRVVCPIIKINDTYPVPNANSFQITTRGTTIS